MSDFFGRYFGRFFGGYFGPSEEQAEGSLSGTIHGSSTVTGTAGAIAHLSGSIQGSSTVSGDWSIPVVRVDPQHAGGGFVTRSRPTQKQTPQRPLVVEKSARVVSVRAATVTAGASSRAAVSKVARVGCSTVSTTFTARAQAHVRWSLEIEPVGEIEEVDEIEPIPFGSGVSRLVA